MCRPIPVQAPGRAADAPSGWAPLTSLASKRLSPSTMSRVCWALLALRSVLGGFMQRQPFCVLLDKTGHGAGDEGVAASPQQQLAEK